MTLTLDIPCHDLILYITGRTARARRAIENIERILGAYPDLDYSLTIVDLLEEPALAEREQIIATPTLIRRQPSPLVKIIGDFSDTEKVLKGLDLQPRM